MKTSQLLFNIIYTPNTAEGLCPFVHSLLQWTDCRYRLVVNGCPPHEREQLKKLSNSSQRLEFVVASEHEMLEHGKVLDWLQEQNDENWFCFMDSDILAIGPGLGSLGTILDDCDVLSSGHPLWHAPEDIVLPGFFRRLQGSYFAMDDGRTLGGTYFAIYNNRLLSNIRKKTGLGFRFYRWDEIDAVHQAKLDNAGLAKLDYDTGKLLMALMHTEGSRFHVAQLDCLMHLGGFSALSSDEPAFHYRGRFDRFACRLLGGAMAGPLLYLADTWYGWRRRSPGLSIQQTRSLTLQERRVMQSRERKRRNTARYFNRLLQSLREGTLPPPVPVLGYQPAEQRIAEASDAIGKLYRHLGLLPTGS